MKTIVNWLRGQKKQEATLEDITARMIANTWKELS